MHFLLMRTKTSYLPVDLQLTLFDQTVLPILTCGCEVFGFENCGLLGTLHTQFLHSILKARKSTPLYMLYGELGRFPIELSARVSEYVKDSVTFHLMCVHIIFSSVIGAGWPIFAAAHSVDHMFS